MSNKTQVKIFSGEKGEKIEVEVNEWLSKVGEIKIMQTIQSSSSSYSRFGNFSSNNVLIVLTFIYQKEE